MRVATTLCGYLDSVLESPCRVKWPNDLIVGQRKIGGILIESVQVGESVAAVIGFGINYSSDLPELAGTATTVVDESRSVPGIAEMLIPMVAALESEVDAEKSMESVVEEYAQWSLHEIGRDLVCRTARGMIRGKFLGFDPLGFLRLETESGEVLISAGEIVEGETRYES
jgi:BirA family biotin operon repressor/biotin-[acetyl-CoA-carboxylase] ligase